MTDYIKDFLKCLESIDYTKRNYDIFQDFLTVSSISLANVVLKREELEKQYFEVIQKYKHPEKLSELFAITTLGLEQKHRDFLGKIFMRCNFGNKNSSQFFTPYHVSQLMAEVVFDKDTIKKTIKEQGFIKVSEPCCGAGGMILAFAETMLKNDINPQAYMVFQGIDIDINCCRMAFIQTSLMGLTGEIVHGDTITLKAWNNFITPMSMVYSHNFKKFKESKQENIQPEQPTQIIEQDCIQLKLI